MIIATNQVAEAPFEQLIGWITRAAGDSVDA